MVIKGIIFRIVNTVDYKVYIGSTLKQLHIRMNGHKEDSKRNKCIYFPLYIHMRVIGYEQFEIEPIKVVTVNNKKELLDKENLEICKIDKNKSLSVLGFMKSKKISDKKYYINNKEKIKLRQPEYYNNNSRPGWNSW